MLAAGRGTRMQRPDTVSTLTAEQVRAADAGSKAMMPVGRPFLDYVLSALADADITDVCIVVSPSDRASRERDGPGGVASRLRVEFAEQAKPLGTADAVRCARDVVREETFVMLNADNVYSPDAIRAVRAIGGCGLAGYRAGPLVRLSNIPRDRLRAYALVRADSTGHVVSIEEKPVAAGADNFNEYALISMNLWSFTPDIFVACDRVTPSVRGELELADAVRIAMQQLGVRFRVVTVEQGVLDLSSRADIASVTERLRDVPVRV